MRWPILAVLLAATLGGCFGENEERPAAPVQSTDDDVPDDPDANGTGDNQTTPPPGNSTPIRELSANITANATNGSAPFNVTFYLNFTDDDGDELNWTLDFGDGNMTNGTARPGAPPSSVDGRNMTEGNGTGNETDPANGTDDAGTGPDGNGTGPDGNGTGADGNGTADNGTAENETQPGSYGTVQVIYSYNWSGNYTVTLTVMDDNTTAEANLTLAADPQEAVVFEDNVSCPGEVFGRNSHDFEVLPHQGTMTVTLAYEGPSNTKDLDMYITDPDGETNDDGATPQGEDPVVFEDPMPGMWNIEIDGFLCIGSADYSVTAAFANAEA